MPQIIIDGVKYNAEAGKTVMETAFSNGLRIPHFCWHPELSVAGNCRMCLVEIGMPRRAPDGSFEKDSKGNNIINFFPKLQIACATLVSEGMEVRTKSAKALQAQEAVMEFFLINHPLDCPICDEAGECKLQEYTFNHSKGESRFTEKKVAKPKRVEWGPNVMYDGERCLLCSRCIRFAKEIAKQDIFTFVQRGDRVYIELADESVWDNPYSMNVINICPVGALTSRDFRFTTRVWEMSWSDSITPADSTGANIKIGVRNNQILRIDPRTNMFVNKYWLTDDTRLNTYKWVNENRLTEPVITKDDKKTEVEWQEAFSMAANELKKFKPEEIMILGSAKASTECNYVLKRFASEVLKTKNIDFLTHINKSFEDDFLGVADRAPNAAGALEVGIKPGEDAINKDTLAEAILSGKIKALYLMEDDFNEYPELEKAIDKLQLFIIHTYNKTDLALKADIALPASTYAEIEGCYINKDNRVQHFGPALVTKENVRFMGMKMSRLDKFGSANDRWTSHELRNCRQSWKILEGIAEAMGAKWNYKQSKDVFAEMSKRIDSFKSMTYDLLDERLGVVLGKGDNPDPVIIQYVSRTLKAQG